MYSLHSKPFFYNWGKITDFNEFYSLNEFFILRFTERFILATNKSHAPTAKDSLITDRNFITKKDFQRHLLIHIYTQFLFIVQEYSRPSADISATDSTASELETRPLLRSSVAVECCFDKIERCFDKSLVWTGLLGTYQVVVIIIIAFTARRYATAVFTVARPVSVRLPVTTDWK